MELWLLKALKEKKVFKYDKKLVICLSYGHFEKKIEVSDCISKSLSQPNPWCQSPSAKHLVLNTEKTSVGEYGQTYGCEYGHTSGLNSENFLLWIGLISGGEYSQVSGCEYSQNSGCE